MNSKPEIAINVGCGDFGLPNVLGVDVVRTSATALLADLQACHLPFRNQSLTAIHAYHVLEHVDLLPVMREFYRVLAPGGKLHIRVPSATSATFWDDPTHKRPFTYRSFDYWQPGYLPDYGFKEKFTIQFRRIRFLGNPEVNRFKVLPWLTNGFAHLLDKAANANPKLCERLWGHWIGGFGEIEFILVKA